MRERLALCAAALQGDVVNAVIRRDTARVILAGPGDRVLLFRHPLPPPWSREGWLTPGGGIDPGETPAETAVRELREETGLVVGLERAVAFDSGEWTAGGRRHAGKNWYFFARVADDRVDLSGQDEVERRDLLDHRWWAVGDLRTTDEFVFPIGLADLLTRLLRGDIPPEPVELPWS
ncbi:MAG TPA: NUDIX domain-containing protein [Streptosporangiaceae bacterium]|nr:NUDIX domain-containing protein [Streptosporangiaceae bacterium]